MILALAVNIAFAAIALAAVIGLVLWSILSARPSQTGTLKRSTFERSRLRQPHAHEHTDRSPTRALQPTR